MPESRAASVAGSTACASPVRITWSRREGFSVEERQAAGKLTSNRSAREWSTSRNLTVCWLRPISPDRCASTLIIRWATPTAVRRQSPFLQQLRGYLKDAALYEAL